MFVIGRTGTFFELGLIHFLVPRKDSVFFWLHGQIKIEADFKHHFQFKSAFWSRKTLWGQCSTSKNQVAHKPNEISHWLVILRQPRWFRISLPYNAKIWIFRDNGFLNKLLRRYWLFERLLSSQSAKYLGYQHKPGASSIFASALFQWDDFQRTAISQGRGHVLISPQNTFYHRRGLLKVIVPHSFSKHPPVPGGCRWNEEKMTHKIYKDHSKLIDTPPPFPNENGTFIHQLKMQLF